ncbi:MAG: sigma-54-dependent transcriptional regulator [Myxococcota bacterium]
MRRSILIVDEDASFRRNASRFLTERGYTVFEAEGADSGLAAVIRHRPEFVVVDVHLKAAPGVDLIETIAQSPDAPQVIGVTSSSRVPEVVSAVKAGAVDVLERPVDGERLVSIIQEVLAVQDALSEGRARPRPVAFEGDLEVDVLVSESPVMKRFLQDLVRRAPAEQCLVLVGEAGSRLEAVAKFFHRAGPRAEGPFIWVQSEDADERLFGSARRTSAFADAKGGIVFIESLVALGPSGQERLTKLLQGLSTSRGFATVRWPPMVIANHDHLGQEERSRRLQPELARLLESSCAHMPPLRERREDIPVLVHRVVSAIEAKVHPRTVRVDGRVVEALVGRDWPNNLDELITTVRNAACVNEEGELYLDLTARPEVHMPALGSTEPVPKPEPRCSEEVRGWQPSLDAEGRVQPYDVYEAEIFRFALHNAGGCVSRAAELLGVGRATMYRKMRAYDIDVPPVSERAITRSRRGGRGPLGRAAHAS